MQLIPPQFFIISTLFVATINLLIPLIFKHNIKLRNIFLLTISIVFCVNVILLDQIFLDNIEIKLDILQFDKYSITLHLEAITMIFLTLLGVLWLCALLYTIKFLEINQIKNQHQFLFFMNCCIMMGILVSLSANLFTMFVGYEILTLCTIPLITHQNIEKSKENVFKYLKILMISSVVLFLPAIIIVYSYVGHGDFTRGGFISGYFSPNYAKILLLMFIFGIAKAAIYPLHGWLPSAMIASYPVSALLHAVVVVKTGLFCIYKILLYVFGLQYLQSLFVQYNWLVLLPIITIIYSSLQAIRFNQIKMVLAYSTINQLSIALTSAFLLSPKGITAAIIHMVSHSFTKICMFYTAGNIYSVKNTYNIQELIGIKNAMPKTSLALLIAGLSLIGMPPFAGFISKFYIMMAAAEQKNLLVMITLIISTIFSALYVIKILIFVYRPTSDKFIFNFKLKPYFYTNSENIDRKGAIQKSAKPNITFPRFMLLSIGLCLVGVIGFFFIQQEMSKFLTFITKI